MIHLSPCLKVPADTSISTCIQKMNESKVGSILVVGDRAEERGLLQGIFTERDVLRNFELLRSEELIEKPVRSIMTKNVQTLEISELQNAATLLLQDGFRHLPVVAGSTTPTPSSDPQRTLLGVISIRDVLRWQVEGSPFNLNPLNEGELPPTDLFIQTDDAELRAVFHSLLKTLEKAGWPFRIHHPESNRVSAPKLRVLDLDGLPAQDWKPKIIEHAGNTQNERVPLILVFDPAQHDHTTVTTLKKLEGHVGALSIFAKPVDLIGLVAVMTKAALA